MGDMIVDVALDCFAPLLRRNIVPRLELMTSNLKEIAVRLDDAARLARSVDQLLEPLTIDESYEVQALSLARRYERGERRVGVKMGFTSRAKMVQMGLDEMIWGRLTDAMLGHPLRSLVAAARLVTQRGEQLNAGDIVLAGAATAAETMTGKRFVQLTVEKLGKVSFTIRS